MTMHATVLATLLLFPALSAAEMTMLDCGVKLKPGSGVGAAVDCFRDRASLAEAA